MKNDPLKEFAQMMAEQVKKSKEISQKPIVETVETVNKQPEEKTNTAIEVSKYLSRPKALKEDIKSEHDRLVNVSNQSNSIPAEPKNIEAQRWNDPLKNTDFVTKKEMNEHYGLFLQRIQQQMATIGGGGEVNLRGLDDVVTSSTGTNKFLTYNPITRKFYFDFINPATESELGGIIPGPGFTIGVDGTLGLNAGDSFYLDETDTFRLNPGTSTRVGGIKSGPGVAIDPDGTLYIDATGVPFTFGDFTGLVGTYSSNTAYALLGSINEDEDIVIASNGSGAVNVVGEFNVFATNSDITDALETFEPIFRVLGDGQVRMLVPAADTLTGAFEIVGNDSGYFHATNQTGVILHTTGNTDSVNRVYHDAINNYPIIVGRRYNGTIGALENVKSGETIFRLAGQASTGTDFETFGPAKINWIATEDQGPSNQGGKITIDVTANGTAAFGNAITAAEFTANGVISDVGFVGDLTGNADTVTNGVYTTDIGTITNTMLAGSIANDKLVNSSITINGDSISLGGSFTISGDDTTIEVSNNVISVINLPNADIGPITSLLFDTSHVDDHSEEGILCWSASDGTLNLHHTDGVVQQIGQELYAYARNETGSEIADGTCVRFAGAAQPDGEARLLIAPFQADGEFPSLYGLGIATQTFSDDEEGRVCVWGKIRGINTTGTPVTETWIVGDILYAHTTVAGGLTKVKPTAPNNVVPVAAVLRVDATEGELFVRPTIEQKMNYGVFTRLSDYTFTATNTGYAIPLTNTEISNGVVIGATTSQLIADQSGLYNVQANLNFLTTGGPSDEDTIYIWFRINGTDVPNTMRRTGIDGEVDGLTVAIARTFSLEAGNYVEVVVAVSNTRVSLDYVSAETAPGLVGPATPAIDVSVNQIQL